jgi:hypothetical protein
VRNAAILSAAIAVILIAGLASRAYANQLDALLLPAEDRSQAQFTAFRNIELKYPQSSSLARLLDGRNERIEFTVNGTGAQALVNAMNRAIQEEQKSPVTLHNATVNYVATIKGQPDRAQLSYKVDVKATIAGYVLQKETGNRSAIVDLDWRNFVMSAPAVIDTERGLIDVNSPAGALQVMMPQLAEKLDAKGAQAIMNDPIMDFSRFNLPMKSWHYLFDVTGLQLKNYGVFMPGEGATVSIHSIGESSFREGTYLPKEMDATVQVDGAQVAMHASTPAPSGQITIAGYSKVQEANGTEYAEVSSKHSGGLEMGFQFQVMLVLAGMMGAVAMFVLYKSRR